MKPAMSMISGAVIFLSSSAALGHHSFAAEFDSDLDGTYQGVVRQVWFNNPHVRYYVAIEDENGEEQLWTTQTMSPNTLVRVGWNADTIREGDRVTLYGNLGRHGAPKLWIRRATLTDGTVLLPFGRDGDSPDYQLPPQPEAADYPDIAGVWIQDGSFGVTVEDLTPKPIPFTERGRIEYESREYHDDPALTCRSTGTPRLFGSPRPIEIIQTPRQITLMNESSRSIRRIYMDGRAVPPFWFASLEGFSTGRWEDNTLVVETTMLSSDAKLDGSGYPHASTQTKLVERYTVSEDGDQIDGVMTITDPLTYTEPLTRVRAWRRDPNAMMVPYDCNPDSFYRELHEAGLLEEYFERRRQAP